MPGKQKLLPVHLLSNQKIHWYPGHMEKSIRHMRERIIRDQIGLVVEVRDARVPLSCVNWKFEQLFSDDTGHCSTTSQQSKNNTSLVFRNAWGDRIGSSMSNITRLIVYNKTDLVDGPDNPLNIPTLSKSQSQTQWRRMILENSKYTSIFSSCNTLMGMNEVLEKSVRNWISMHHDSMKSMPSCPYPPLNILIIGMPNTGKSSLINRLRAKGMIAGSHHLAPGKRTSTVAEVGKNPGHTRHVSSKIKIIDTETISITSRAPTTTGSCYYLDDPELQSRQRFEPPIVKWLRQQGIRLKVYIMDSPGILPPHFLDVETKLKLALVHSMPSSLGCNKGADPVDVAEYLWWRLRERWNLSEIILRKFEAVDSHGVQLAPLEYGNVNGESVKPFLKHYYHTRLVNEDNMDNRTVRRRKETEILEISALSLLRMWREGDLYRSIGLFPKKPAINPPESTENDDHPSNNERKLSTGKLSKDRIEMLKDLWRVTIVDDEFLDGKEYVKQWFEDRYNPHHGNHEESSDKPIVVVRGSSKVKIGDLYVDETEIMSAADRKKLKKKKRT